MRRPVVERTGGRVVGLGEKYGGWKLTDAPRVGTFAPRAKSRCVAGVPVPRKLASSISGYAIRHYAADLSIHDVPYGIPVLGCIAVRSLAVADQGLRG